MARSEPRTRTALVLESIALRHQIAVLKRSGTRRPCFRRIDRLFWILFSCWWPQSRESLVIVQPETILRWRREGWSGIWRYRSRGRWRGGRPRISNEIRHLITQMARENFLWGAPRIHGELLMLGFAVSQATVSRYLAALGRRPTQSWRSFLRNQAGVFIQYSEPRSNRDAHPHDLYRWAPLIRAGATPIATACVGGRRALAGQRTVLNSREFDPRRYQSGRIAMHRALRRATISAGFRKVPSRRLAIAVPVRSPPSEARA